MRKLNVIIIASLVVFLTLCIAVPQGWSGVLSPSVSVERYIKAKAIPSMIHGLSTSTSTGRSLPPQSGSRK